MQLMPYRINLIILVETLLMNIDRLNQIFDDILTQTIAYGFTHEQLDAGRRRDGLEQVKEWKLKYGYKFSVYSNDHLIDGKRHFHFDNAANDIRCKFDFEGNILESSGRNEIPANVLKDLRYFLNKGARRSLDEMWERLNPNV